MANEIKTRPQGYRGPVFDNEEQQRKWQDWARRVASVILAQIKAAPASIWQSWALQDPACIVWDGKPGLTFRVDGLQLCGRVVVTLDEGRDLYDVETLQEIDGEMLTKQQQRGIFCDDLAAAIDAMVERPEGMTDEEYAAALRAKGDPLLSFLISKAEQGQSPQIVTF